MDKYKKDPNAKLIVCQDKFGICVYGSLNEDGKFIDSVMPTDLKIIHFKRFIGSI